MFEIDEIKLSISLLFEKLSSEPNSILSKKFSLAHSNLIEKNYCVEIGLKMLNEHQLVSEMYLIVGELYFLNKDFKNARVYYCYYDQITNLYKKNKHDILLKRLDICYKMISDKKFCEHMPEGLVLDNRFKIQNKKLIGEKLKFIDNEYYLGRYHDYSTTYLTNLQQIYDTVLSKCEILEIKYEGKNFIQDKEGQYLIPIANKHENSEIQIINNNKSANYNVGNVNQFDYFKVIGPVEFKSDKDFVIGKPIKIKGDKEEKLIINIFIDSLPYKYLENENFKKNMPNTFNFFKEAIKLENYYGCAECTYPSVGNITTGHYTTKHKMTHYGITAKLPENIKTLFEIFQDNGFHVAKIGGNGSVCADLGYIRGVDRCVYKYYDNSVQVIDDTIEHLETFKGVNKFLWLEFMDLHALSRNYNPSTSVQANIDYRLLSKDNIGKNSVIQSFSENKEQVFIAEMKRLDTKLEVLYNYISNNYKNENITVTLFSDHGTSFLIQDVDFFMSKERVHIPFYIIGNKFKNINVNEIISTVDFTNILCSIAGILNANKETDGQLPVFFGGRKEREFAFSECIYPNEPYTASIVSKEHLFYFKTVNPTTIDCRIDVSKFETKLLSHNFSVINDNELIKYFQNIVIKHVEEMKI